MSELQEAAPSIRKLSSGAPSGVQEATRTVQEQSRTHGQEAARLASYTTSAAEAEGALRKWEAQVRKHGAQEQADSIEALIVSLFGVYGLDDLTDAIQKGEGEGVLDEFYGDLPTAVAVLGTPAAYANSETRSALFNAEIESRGVSS